MSDIQEYDSDYFDETLEERILSKNYQSMDKGSTILSVDTLNKYNICKVTDPETNKVKAVHIINDNNYFLINDKKLRHSANKVFGYNLVQKNKKELFICDDIFDAMVLNEIMDVNAVAIFNSIDEIIDSYEILDNMNLYFLHSTGVFKDINDYLRMNCRILDLKKPIHKEMAIAGNIDITKEYISALRNPQSIKKANLNAMMSEGLIKERTFGYSTGFKKLDFLTKGLSTDLVGVGAGTGSGKTTMVNQIAYALQKQGLKVGYMLFEQESENETLLNIAGHYDRINYNYLFQSSISSIDYDYEFEEVEEDTTIDKNEGLSDSDKEYLTNNYLEPRVKELIDKDCIEILSNDNGTMDVEEALRTVRALVIQSRCDVILLDHTTYLTDGVENQNQAAQVLMKGLKDIMHRHKVIIIYVTHLRKSKSSSDTHEEGARVKLDDFAGGKAVVQYATVVLGLERDMQNEDEEAAQITKLRLLKRRGVGVAPGDSTMDLKFDVETNKLYPSNCRKPLCGYDKVPF